MNTFIDSHYEDIVAMAKRICKGSQESEDVASHCMLAFIQHERAKELIEANEAMKFLSGMIWRSFKSSTSPYHKLYRQSGRVHELYDHTLQNVKDEEYDQETDLKIEAIQGLIEEMKAEGVDQWFRATLFEMWLQESNYSELSRVTQIPRTSISQAVNECREYIRYTLNQRGIE